MKKFIILILFCSPVQAKVITLDIPDTDIAIIEHDVVDAEQWIKDAVAGKLAKCKERLLKKEIETSVKNGETLPAGEVAIIQKAFDRPEYKSRKEIEAEIKSVVDEKPIIP